MVKMPDLGLEGASEFDPRRDHVFFFFIFSDFFFCKMYVTQTPQTSNSA